MSEGKVSEGGALALPTEVRRAAHLRRGEELKLIVLGEGALLARRVRPGVETLANSFGALVESVPSHEEIREYLREGRWERLGRDRG